MIGPDVLTDPGVLWGSREDPLLSGRSNAITAYHPDFDTLTAAPTRVVIAAGTESQGTLTARTAAAAAEARGQPVTVFPSHHACFLGGEFGQHGEPETFAAPCDRSSTATGERDCRPHAGHSTRSCR